ncbi:MAG: TetR/AcrR family transcriptional regulator [Rhodobacteraceae bacterium]|nr:TetR/AcrR family transcriptional regulator [Paracoccaceae bacterium]
MKEGVKSGRQTSRRILDASQSLIAEHGYAAVSMRTIAEAVGVNVGALYNHFATKQQILVTLMSGHMEGLLAAWEQARPGDPDPRVQLDTFARFHVHHHVTRKQAVFIAYMELRSLEEIGHAEIVALRGRYEDYLKDILAAGRDQGLFDIADVHVAATALLAMLTGVNTWYQPGGRLSEQEIEDIYAELALKSVGATRVRNECSTPR